MKKSLLLIMILGLWHNADTQSYGNLEQYYYMGNRQAFTFVPIVSYQTSRHWYFEGRYNYEAPGAFSIYAGKTFKNEASFSYSVTPVAGIVTGGFKGGSAGANIDLEYKKFSFSSQCQYTFSIECSASGFLYNWSDLGYQVSSWLSAGLSTQQTKLHKLKCEFERGAFINVEVSSKTFSFYVFNPESNARYFIVGLNFEWQHGKAAASIIRGRKKEYQL